MSSVITSDSTSSLEVLGQKLVSDGMGVAAVACPAALAFAPLIRFSRPAERQGSFLEINYLLLQYVLGNSNSRVFGGKQVRHNSLSLGYCISVVTAAVGEP